MNFNASQLDKDFYLTRAKSEANEIFSNESTRRGRSFQNILETTLYGHAAEVYLIQECGFKDDERKYQKNNKEVLQSFTFSFLKNIKINY